MTQLHLVSLPPHGLLHLFNLENAVLLNCYWVSLPLKKKNNNNSRLPPFSFSQTLHCTLLIPSPGLPSHPLYFHSSFSPNPGITSLLLHPGSHSFPSCIPVYSWAVQAAPVHLSQAAVGVWELELGCYINIYCYTNIYCYIFVILDKEQFAIVSLDVTMFYFFLSVFLKKLTLWLHLDSTRWLQGLDTV